MRYCISYNIQIAKGKQTNMKPSSYLQHVATLIRFKNPIGWVLVGLPGSWLLIQHPTSITTWILWWAGAFFARSAGCIINDWCDRDIDKHVDRTKHRPFTTGKLTRKDLFCLLTIFGSISLIIAALIGKDILLRSLFIIPWITLYPTAKRWLSIPQLFLAPVFAYSIIVANMISPHPHAALWYIASCAWIMGFDTIYAVSDIQDDQRLHINSAPKTLGKATPLFVSLCYLTFISIVTLLTPPSSMLQWICYGAFALLLSLQVMNMYQSPIKLFKQNAIIGLLVGVLNMLHASNW